MPCGLPRLSPSAFTRSTAIWHQPPVAPRVAFVAFRGNDPAKGVDWGNPDAQWTEFLGGCQTADGGRACRPTGVAVGSDGVVYVAESHGGRVVKLSGGKAETVVDGLTTPQGLLVQGGRLYIVDAGAKALVEYELKSGARQTVAANLPVGSPPGVTPKFLGAIGDMSGPMGAFAGITAGADGLLYVSGDAEGSVLAIRRV